MKANNGKGNNISRDNCETPRLLFDELNLQYDFEFDCCANFRNTKTKKYATDFELVQEKISLTAWMNPPFSKAHRMFEHFFKVIKKGVAIYRFDNAETKIWQEVIFPNCSWVFIFNKRINYVSNGEYETVSSRFPSALIGLNIEPPNRKDGVTVWVK